MSLLAMTYNIRTGGGDRLGAVAGVVAAQAPDLLAVQELGRRGRGPADPVRGLADALGMRAYAAGPALPTGQRVAVFVRPGVRVLEAGPVRGPFHHGAARVVVDTSAGPLTVLATHLNPYAGRARLAEARRLARHADPARPLLLLGDLNSLSPHADHAATLDRLPDRYRSRHLHRGRADTRAVAALHEAGLVDLFRLVGAGGLGVDAGGAGAGHTVPTGFAGGEFAPMRLDYAFATPALARRAVECRVVTGGAAATASDHFPLTVRFDLRLPAASANVTRGA